MSKPGPKRRRAHFSQQGVALLAVTVAVAVVLVLSLDFSTHTNVDQRAARNAEADMKMHFLARSGMNLSQLLIRVQTQILDSMPGNIQIDEFIPLITPAFGAGPEEIEGMAAMLGGFAGDLKGLGVAEGQFDVHLTTDDSKINVNCAGGRKESQDNLYAQLGALFYPDAFHPIFENATADGWRRDRETQVAAIIDYIDADRVAYNPAGTSGGPEDYGYEGLADKYQPKNSYIDTVGELRLVRGVDDRFWTLFGDAFTVYGDCVLNLLAVSDPNVLASIMILALDDSQNDPQSASPQNLWTMAQLVIQARQIGFSFTSEQEFMEFVKSPQDAAGALAGGGLGGVNPSRLGAEAGMLMSLLQQVRGVTLDPAKLGRIARVGPRRTYRVEATASYDAHRATKRIVGVWDNQAPNNQNTRTPGNLESRDRGAWVFWRED